MKTNSQRLADLILKMAPGIPIRLEPTTRLVEDLDYDSISLMQLLSKIETTFKCAIPYGTLLQEGTLDVAALERMLDTV